MPNQPASVPSDPSAAFIARALREGLPDALDQAVGRDIEIDMGEIGKLDAAALKLLIAAKWEAADRNKNIRFINHDDPALLLLELCDLGGFFTTRRAAGGMPENVAQPPSS